VTDRDEGGLGLTMRVPKAEQKATLAEWERIAVKRMQRKPGRRKPEQRLGFQR